MIKQVLLTTLFIFNLGLLDTGYALVCPDPSQIVMIKHHWVVLGMPKWQEAPYVSAQVFGKVHFSAAMWSNGWVAETLKDRPHCFYWVNDDYEEHAEFIYRDVTPNPKLCGVDHWKWVGGKSQGVICTAKSRLSCRFPMRGPYSCDGTDSRCYLKPALADEFL